MKNSFKYFNNFVEKLHYDKSPTPAKSPLKVVNVGLDSKVSTLANTASLEERIKTGTFQNKALNQLTIKDSSQNQTYRNHQEISKNGVSNTDRYEEVFRLRKEILDFRDKEKRYIGKIHDLEKENTRLLGLIRQNERDFNEKIQQKQSEKQEILKKYTELKVNIEHNPIKMEDQGDEEIALSRIINELNNKINEIEKNAIYLIKEKKTGKENVLGDETLIKSHENSIKKCKEMEFIIFHLHKENLHLKQYANFYWDSKQEKFENSEEPIEIMNMPIPGSLKIMDLAKKNHR